MGNLDDFLASNAQFAAKISPEDAAKPMPPARKAAIITCMDARLHPEAALGLEIGDCHVIRNAGEDSEGIECHGCQPVNENLKLLLTSDPAFCRRWEGFC